MSDWDLPLPAYWDQATGAINRHVRRLMDLGEVERAAAHETIRDAVSRRLRALSDDWLLRAAVSLVDDLYKFVNDEVLVDRALYTYLDAFARTFTRHVSERGYAVHYLVENRFASVDVLLRGPLDLFPPVFNAAGFVYVCPQQLALQLMQADGLPSADYGTAIAQYIAEARVLGDRLVNQCQATRRHYVFLETDYQAGALDAAFQGHGSPGVLTVFRNEAPGHGSAVSIGYPPEKFGD